MAQQVQGALFGVAIEPKPPSDTSSTFADNLRLPVHRWFRYSAGFSASWVNAVIRAERQDGRCKVLDPFSGGGTVLLEAETVGVNGRGIENHPFISRVAQAKLSWRASPSEFAARAFAILDRARRMPQPQERYSTLIEKCFSPESIQRLDALRRSWVDNADGSGCSGLIWLALVSILRPCSHVGTAQWQYVLPNKTKSAVAEPFRAFEEKVYLMEGDMKARQRSVTGPPAVQHVEDARSFSSVSEGWADLVITSPPYANNYDYADATRLEMTFMREIDSWGDLQTAVRAYLVRSCTQHVASTTDETFSLLESPLLETIRTPARKACEALHRERERHGGKKPYHAMVAAYFLDLARVWRRLRRACADGAKVCFVVGDSAPYGIHIPVDTWLGELAVAAGFRGYSFEKTRDRNVKWKNRKHTVPLKEGRLWVEG